MYFDNSQPTSPMVLDTMTTPSPSRHGSISSSFGYHPRGKHVTVYRTPSSASTQSVTSQQLAMISPPPSEINGQSDLAYLKDENRRLRIHYMEISNRCNELEDQLEQLRTERDMYEHSSSRSAEELTQLRRIVASSIDLSEYDRMKVELDQLKLAIAQSLQSERQLRRELQQSRDLITSLQDENINIQRRNDLMRDDLKRFEEEKEGFEKFVMEVGELQNNLDQYKEKLAQSQEENEELKRVVQKCVTEQNVTKRRSRNFVGTDGLHLMNYDLLGSNTSLVTISSLSNLQPAQLAGTQFGSTTSVQTLTTNSTPNYPHQVPRTSLGSIMASSISPIRETFEGEEKQRPESMLVIRTKELELQVEEERTEKMELVKQMEELATEKKFLEQQAIHNRERIDNLEKQLKFEKENSKTRQQTKTVFLEPKIELIYMKDLDLSIDDLNNNPDNNESNEKEEEETTKMNNETNEQTFLERTPSQNNKTNNRKPKKKRWFRFLICFHATSTKS